MLPLCVCRWRGLFSRVCGTECLPRVHPVSIPSQAWHKAWKYLVYFEIHEKIFSELWPDSLEISGYSLSYLHIPKLYEHRLSGDMGDKADPYHCSGLCTLIIQSKFLFFFSNTMMIQPTVLESSKITHRPSEHCHLTVGTLVISYCVSIFQWA